MKKLFLLSSLFVAVLMFTGCAYNNLADLTPRWPETRADNESYEVLNPKAGGKGSVHIVWLWLISYSWGGSFEDAYQEALLNNPGADDLINLRVNATALDLLLYRRFDFEMHGTAIRYTSNGKSVKDK